MDLEDLFSGHGAVCPEFKVVRVRPHVQRNRDKVAETKGEAPGVRKPPKDGAVHVRRKRPDPREGRTVFVGNIPVSITRRKLTQLFKQHGKVISVRLRSITVEKGDLPVKVAKRLHKQIAGTTMNAYVVFDSEENAEKSVALNGALVGDRHIRVDTLSASTAHKRKRSVFVGNLPYNADEEEVRRVFVECGEVEAVRLVRDRETNAGKGFGFVTFAERSGVMFALQQSGQLELEGKKLRIFKSKDMKAVQEQAGREKGGGRGKGRGGGGWGRRGGGRGGRVLTKSRGMMGGPSRKPLSGRGGRGRGVTRTQSSRISSAADFSGLQAKPKETKLRRGAAKGGRKVERGAKGVARKQILLQKRKHSRKDKD